MSSEKYNLVVVLACLAFVLGGGVYLTYHRQGGELERVRRAKKVAEMKRAEISTLLAEYADTKTQAQAVVRKWRSRYKIIPDTLSSPEVIGYLNDLTQQGFKNFDVTVAGRQQEEGYSRYVVQAQGRGYYSSLYRFVWQIENSRLFWSIDDLSLDHIDLITKNEETGRKRLQVMVSFSMNLSAYFGGPAGASASSAAGPLAAAAEVPRPRSAPSVPAAVLADRRPEVNPFFPVVMDQLPPNTAGLLNVETADFVSIIGGEAVFKDAQGYRRVAVGDAVYLGQITDVNVLEGSVTARLNKGGIIDEVTRYLTTAPRYERAKGAVRLTPVGDASTKDSQ